MEDPDLDDGDIMVLVLDYLRRKKLMSTVCSMEEETGMHSKEPVQEIKILKDLVLKGKWSEAETFIETIEASDGAAYNKALFAIRKQMFLELINEGEKRPEVSQLVQVLKDLEELCDKAEFKELCFFLTLSDIHQHPEYTKWSLQGGRYNAFDSISDALVPLFGPPSVASERTPHGPARLEEVLRRGVKYHAESLGATRAHPDALLRDTKPDETFSTAKTSTKKPAVVSVHQSIDLSHTHKNLKDTLRTAQQEEKQRLTLPEEEEEGGEQDRPASVHGNGRLQEVGARVVDDDDDDDDDDGDNDDDDGGVIGVEEDGRGVHEAMKGGSDDGGVKEQSDTSHGVGRGGGGIDEGHFGVDEDRRKPRQSGGSVRTAVAWTINFDESQQLTAPSGGSGGGGGAGKRPASASSSRPRSAGPTRKSQGELGGGQQQQRQSSGGSKSVRTVGPLGNTVKEEVMIAARASASRSSKDGKLPPKSLAGGGFADRTRASLEDNDTRVIPKAGRAGASSLGPSAAGMAANGVREGKAALPSIPGYADPRRSNDSGKGYAGLRKSDDAVKGYADLRGSEDAVIGKGEYGSSSTHEGDEEEEEEEEIDAPALGGGGRDTGLDGRGDAGSSRTYGQIPDSPPDSAGGWGNFSAGDMACVDVLADTDVIRCVAWCDDEELAGTGGLVAYGTTSRGLRIAGASYSGLMMLMDSPTYHQGSIYALAWAPGLPILASASNDKTLQITEVRMGDDGASLTHSTPSVLTGHTGTVRCIAWLGEHSSPGSNLLMSAGAGDCAVRLWDAERGVCVSRLSGHTGAIQAAAVSDDFSLFATGDKDGQVRMWDVRSHSAVCSAGMGGEVLSLAFNHGSSHVAAGFADGWCRVYDASGLGEASCLRPHDTEIRSLSFVHDQTGEVLFSGSFDGTIAVSDAETGELVQRIAGHADRVVQAVPHPVHPWLLSCSVDKTLRLWM